MNRKIHQAHGLEPLWGCWQSIAFNYDRAATLGHVDKSNTGDIPCGVLVGENSDPAAGGQLVLEDLGLCLELRAGDLVIFPSALIKHWNCALAPGQARSSIAVWCSAAVEMWADENCEPRTGSGPRPYRAPAEALRAYHAL